MVGGFLERFYVKFIKFDLQAIITTTLTIRQKLITYLTNADNSKIEAIYTLLEKDIQETTIFTLSKEQLDNEHNTQISNQSISYVGEQDSKIIRRQSVDNKTPIKDILNKKYVIISIIGSHAGDEISHIFSWKIKEVQRNIKTYWLVRSRKAQTMRIQEFCNQAKKEDESVYCLFITTSSKNGARPTTAEIYVNEISENKVDWLALLADAKIKGKIDSQSAALVLSELEMCNTPQKINLEDYSELDIEQNTIAVKFALGASTICCKKVSSIGMKSSLRTILAWGRLDEPYAVWVR